MSAPAVDLTDRRALTADLVGTRVRAAIGPLGLVGLLFFLALAARLPGLDLFVTPDEDNWMRRAANFSRALQTGRVGATYQSGHPGVTTMWIASLGMGPEGVVLGGITTDDPATIVTRRPEWPWLFERARRTMVLANAALIAIIGVLAWRLLGSGPALIGGGLMALDPFLVAHGQVVHVDALVTAFMTVAMLAAGIYWFNRGGWGYLAVCAVACGLGIVTKAPSAFLAVFVPVVAVAAAVIEPRAWPPRRLVLSSCMCGLGVLLTVFVAWPALWDAPLDTVVRVAEYQVLQSATPHDPGNFFFGAPVADPGALFYPIAVMLRLTPIVVLGLVALVALLPPPSIRRQTALLAAFVLGFLMFVTLASKKLDRYALPMFPSLALLASVGLWSAWLTVSRRLTRIRPSVAWWGAPGLIALALLGQALALVSVAPYPLAYYSPLLGGGPVAQRTILVGWGEGLDQVAQHLNAQPDASTSEIAVYFTLTLNFQGMVVGSVHRFTDPVPVSYVVDYVNVAQRGQTPPDVLELTPDLVVRINGIDYARVYRLDPPRVLTQAMEPPPE